MPEYKLICLFPECQFNEIHFFTTKDSEEQIFCDVKPGIISHHRSTETSSKLYGSGHGDFRLLKGKNKDEPFIDLVAGEGSVTITRRYNNK